VYDILKLYVNFFEKILCLPVIFGKKTEGEKFAGAVFTTTCEVYTQEAIAIQAATSHYLGTNFSDMYELSFQDKNNQFSKPHYMSAGSSTRMIGCLIACHADEKGLVLPFDIAINQISVIPLLFDKESDKNVLAYVEKINAILKKYTVSCDKTFNSMGEKLTN
jgi:prolyl-tRNA synthetase